MTGFVVADVERIVAGVFPRLHQDKIHYIAKDIALGLVGEPVSDWPLIVRLVFDDYGVGRRLPDRTDRLTRVVDAMSSEAA